MYDDTICAISTSMFESAINVIRISGNESIQIINKIFKGKDLEKVETHTINYGHIVDNGIVIDEVLVSVFKSPRSFTKETSVEVSTHGGSFVTNKVLELLITNGCRLAENGEFTKRAFLNGRIDLVEAEAVMDVLSAKNSNSLRLANDALSGRLSLMLDSLNDEILNIIANIEVNIDYPEYTEIESLYGEALIPKITDIINKMNNILENSETGRIIREGINTVIIGKPNVGKSSLLNSLLGEDKAIVTNIKGTTRDTVEGYINIGGLTLNLIDTAGIHETTDIIEKIGIDKSLSILDKADLVLLVLDNSTTLDKYDTNLLSRTKNKTRIIISNKDDLDSKLSLNEDYIKISTINNKGIVELGEKIKTIFLNDNAINSNKIYLSNVRHISLMKQSKESLKEALDASIRGEEIDLIEIDLKTAWNNINEILGKDSTVNLLDELFSRFCLGK